MATIDKYTDKNAILDTSKISTLDDFFTYSQPSGSVAKAVTNTLYGISNQNVKSMVPLSRDSYGLVFFTRPQLNLTATNLRNTRKTYDFLTHNDRSIHMYVRNMLDPRIWFDNTGPKIRSKLIDHMNPFIPVLTNAITNVSGWPDIVLPVHTSSSGLRKEQWGIGDGVTDIYEAFTLNCTFRNIKDDPITLMFQLWTYYISNVFEGMYSPYLDMIAENEIDYNTRIYRLVLDETKTFVKKISATGAAFPISVPTGKFFDFQDTGSYNDQTREVNMAFQCFGAEYNDSILVREFNMTGAIFNPDIRNMMNGKPHNLQKIPQPYLDALNYRGYPFINPDTLELEWYIDTTTKFYKKFLEYQGIFGIGGTNYVGNGTNFDIGGITSNGSEVEVESADDYWGTEVIGDPDAIASSNKELYEKMDSEYDRLRELDKPGVYSVTEDDPKKVGVILHDDGKRRTLEEQAAREADQTKQVVLDNVGADGKLKRDVIIHKGKDGDVVYKAGSDIPPEWKEEIKADKSENGTEVDLPSTDPINPPKPKDPEPELPKEPVLDQGKIPTHKNDTRPNLGVIPGIADIKKDGSGRVEYVPHGNTIEKQEANADDMIKANIGKDGTLTRDVVISYPDGTSEIFARGTNPFVTVTVTTTEPSLPDEDIF